MNHLNPIDDAFHTVTGLSFNKPLFSGSTLSHQYNLIQSDRDFFEECLIGHHNNPILTEIGQPVSISMAHKQRIPIILSQIEIPNLHQTLNKELGNRGIMDMLIKLEGSSNIVLPIELISLEPIIKNIAKAEQYLNPQYIDWNMWLLLDSRPISTGRTQRNGGYHYDGLNLGGKYKGSPLVSIYGWCNKLPTQFYIGKVEFPPDFDGTRDNASILAQRQIKRPEHIIMVPLNTIVRFDGASPHSGSVSAEAISDRIFIRVCFTAPGVLFDRFGNTHNPAFDYKDPRWERVCPDPAIQFKNTVIFRHPQEFKNMWDIACHEHSAFAIQNNGSQSHEYALIQQLRYHNGPRFLSDIIKLYDEEIAHRPSDVVRMKRDLLKLRYYF